jgi:hypothetical protein
MRTRFGAGRHERYNALLLKQVGTCAVNLRNKSVTNKIICLSGAHLPRLHTRLIQQHGTCGALRARRVRPFHFRSNGKSNTHVTRRRSRASLQPPCCSSKSLGRFRARESEVCPSWGTTRGRSKSAFIHIIPIFGFVLMICA